MKKFALVALFAVAVFGMAFAGTKTLWISGEAPEVFTLTLPPNYSGTIENGSTTQTLFIGNVVVNSNVDDWTIEVTTANQNYLYNSADTNERIFYRITLGSLLPDPIVLPDAGWMSDPQPRTPKAGLTLPFSLIIDPSDNGYQGYNFYQAGTYSDTIVFTIAHN